MIALGGQTIKMSDGRLWIDQVEVKTTPQPDYVQLFDLNKYGIMPRCGGYVRIGETCKIKRLTETLANGVSYDVLDIEDDSSGNNTDEITVPTGYFFVLGDNRDDAWDSRFSHALGAPGMIPIENLVGIVE